MHVSIKIIKTEENMHYCVLKTVIETIIDSVPKQEDILISKLSLCK